MVLVACASDTATDPGSNPLAGLTIAESNDTVPSPPRPQTPATPGSILGFVLGYGTGPDTMATAPRLANVVVTAYPHVGWNGQVPALGDAAATRTTDASGWFEFPTLPGGDYVVTFVPPPNSPYRGTYVMTQIHSGSRDGRWWVFLPPVIDS
jgi:hypothetical protein